ncbi:MAG: type II toxin-antitoxin system VapC family toxin [Candidatus Omnitrophica bacterium]|nr:type II toxin-antitoxin system VapC family toxin [Candidatus Omnitrophota bacterium]MCA9437348.1 type II toxin-antitoxin system VapC family toxin [Candidatus Omnitrophota bacterium]MCA9448592.1 type II toxin-antitoxin system VapC family toxin [Candidatus Omnitrophota bacterium]
MRVYLDSDVLIWHLRGEPKAKRFLKRVWKNDNLEPWTGAVQRGEIVFFMKPEEEEATLEFLSHFATAPVTREIIDRAGELYRKWNPSHGVDFNDAILAATAMETGGKVFTLNTKHYPMKDVEIEKAW